MMSRLADWLRQAGAKFAARLTGNSAFGGPLRARDRSGIRARIAALPNRPVFSLVMPVFDPPAWALEKALASVRAQLYENWELCIADDCSILPHVREILLRAAAADKRIKVTFRQTNGHIAAASNSALALASGEFIGLLDHDDELAEHALYVMAEYVNQRPDAHILYSDEDKIDARGRHYQPHFKPDWNELLLFSYNFISHFGVYRTDLVRRLGGFRSGFEGSQDYDLALRCAEHSRPGQIVHAPYVLYHWRALEGSAAARIDAKSYAFDAALRALNETFRRKNYRGEVVARTPGPAGLTAPVFHVREPGPCVAIIIPTRNQHQLLAACIGSVIEKTDYANYRIVVVDNQSDDPETLRYLRTIAADRRVEVLDYDQPFNFSAINNFAVGRVSDEFVCLLNNDTEIIDGGWLREMVSQTERPDVGVVGARLSYADGTVQHAGVIVGLGGVAGHCFLRASPADTGYFHRAAVPIELSAVTGACMLARRDVFWQAGGLDEAGFRIAFNDIDFCLRVRELGTRVVYTPATHIIHHESRSRGYEDTPEKQARFTRECQLFRRRWSRWIESDPAYNRNLSLRRWFFPAATPRATRFWLGDDAPPLPPTVAEDDCQNAGPGFRLSHVAPAIKLPLRTFTFAPGTSGMAPIEATIDGWRVAGVGEAITARHVLRLTGGADVGGGEAVQATHARLSVGDRVHYLELESEAAEPSPDNAVPGMAPGCRFNLRVLACWFGPGRCRIDILQTYGSFAADIQNVAEAVFLPDDTQQRVESGAPLRTRL